MKQLLFYFFFAIITCNAQSKEELYFDIDSTAITKSEFLKRTDHTINVRGSVEKNGVTINKLFIRKKIDTLSSEKYIQLRKYLNLSASDFNHQIIVINYYSGLDTVLPNEGKYQWNIYSKSYPKKLKKMGNISQFWIYKYDDNLNYHHANEINWYHDKSGFIEKTFFPYHFNSGNCAVILPNGKYYTYFGEYGPDEVYAGINELKKNYAN
ncbi:hypothetical protein [Flavobacterium suzhouense]|uniref:Uncharacterized protein n=1 Tax=Flavobacterium suzhouense TaxID=1529638 RepID=A0ABW5NZJ6_9FLAO